MSCAVSAIAAAALSASSAASSLSVLMNTGSSSETLVIDGLRTPDMISYLLFDDRSKSVFLRSEVAVFRILSRSIGVCCECAKDGGVMKCHGSQARQDKWVRWMTKRFC